MLDERLLAVPAVAVERCRHAVESMARHAVHAFESAVSLLAQYDEKAAEQLRGEENLVDRFEDRIGAFLVRISTQNLSDEDSFECTKLLRLIGEYERICDHAVNLLESAEEIQAKHIAFSQVATQELHTLIAAVREIVTISFDAFCTGNAALADRVEPLEQVVDGLRNQIKLNHTLRLQKSECTIEHGFVLSDILTNLERVSDHCSNVAVCIREMSQHSPLGAHDYLDHIQQTGKDYQRQFEEYREKYKLA